MKILAFVDIHGRLEIIDEITETAKREKPDILIDAGDISWFGKNAVEGLKRLDSCGIPLLILHGNHESASGLKSACSKFQNIVFLHNGSYETGDYVFFGHGGGGFARVDEDFERTAEKFLKKYDRKKKLVLIVHAPIYKTKLDYIHGEHRGNESYRVFIEKVQPKLVICGHFHESERKRDIVGKSIVVNPGARGLLFEFKEEK